MIGLKLDPVNLKTLEVTQIQRGYHQKCLVRAFDDSIFISALMYDPLSQKQYVYDRVAKRLYLTTELKKCYWILTEDSEKLK